MDEIDLIEEDLHNDRIAKTHALLDRIANLEEIIKDIHPDDISDLTTEGAIEYVRELRRRAGL